MHGRKAITLLGILTLLLSLLPLGAATATPIKQDALDKVELLVLEELAANGQTDFFLWMEEKADLSPAAQLQTKLEKGRFVYETLVATAERTQAPLRAYLDTQGVDYQALYIANKVLVRGGDKALLLSIAARPDVAKITANHHFQLDEPIISPNPPSHVEAVEPNISFVKADQVWSLGITGQGTVLAGMDTGIDETHPALARHYRGCLNPPTCSVWDHNYNWWDATGTFPNDPFDDAGHGTHTIGTIVGDDGGGNQIGMAPGAQAIHCRAWGRNIPLYEANLNECLQWTLAPWDLNGLNPRPELAPDAINNSWGFYGYVPAWEDEIAALQAAGILVEVSAGNAGPACSTLGSPGAYEQVLTTGSVDHAQPYPGLLTDFSSRGPSPAYPLDYFPDVMAPGENIRSSIPGGGYQGGWIGTSMSGPHAVGLVGLIWSACPTLQGQVETTMQIIKYTAVPLAGQGGSNCGGDYTTGPNNDWGYGTIDALAAVQEALAQCTDVGYLDGYVSDAANMNPIENAVVLAYWDSGDFWGRNTDATGYYTMTALAGTYTITASAFGYYADTVTGVDVLTGAVTTQDLSLITMPTYIISGTVSDADTGAPLSATVAVLNTPLPPAQSDPATGFYSLTVPTGSYTFLVESWGYYPLNRPVVADQDQTQDFRLEPLYFVPHRGNPMLEVGPDGSWEDWWVGLPDIVLADGLSYLFYTGIDGLVSRKYTIGYATSTDGLSFTKSVSNPILAGDSSGFDAYNVATPVVLVEDGTWILYYSGAPYHDPQEDWYQIGRATAPGPAGPWIRGYYPVLSRGGYGEWDYDKVIVNSVVATDEGYVMYYSESMHNLGDPAMIGMATSPDGLTWHKYDDPSTPYPPYAGSDPVLYPGAPGEWDSARVFGGYARQTAGGWEMLYNGCDDNYYLVCPLGYATSADGIAWHKYAGNPVLEPQQDPWAELCVGYPSVVVSGTTYVVYYDRYYAPGGIGLATGGVCMPLAEAVFGWQPLTPTVGEAVAFVGSVAGSDPVTFTWDLGDGLTGTGRVITHTYANTGTFTVTLTATNCETGTARVTHTVTVVPPCDPVETVLVQGPAFLLTGETGLYTATYTPPTATTPVILTWAASGGGAGTVGPTAAYSWTMPGSYTLTVTATNACGVVQDTFTVEVCQEVEAVAIAGPAFLLVGEAGIYTASYAPITATAPVTFTWDNSTVGGSEAYSWTMPGSYTITVTATNACAVAQDTFTVEVCQPVEAVSIEGPVNLLVGEAGIYTATHAPITATAPVTFTWDNGTVGPSAAYSWTMPGSYTIAVTATNACGVVQGTFTVEVCQQVEAVAVQGPATLLVGEAGIYTATYTPITATTPVTLTWDNGTVGPSAVYSWTIPGSYTLTVTATNECSVVRDTFTVEVCQQVETVAIAGPAALLAGQTGHYTATYAPITATTPVTFTWDNGMAGPVAAYSWTMPGSYTLTVTATNACGWAGGGFVVEVSPIQYEIYLPLVLRNH